MDFAAGKRREDERLGLFLGGRRESGRFQGPVFHRVLGFRECGREEEEQGGPSCGALTQADPSPRLEFGPGVPPGSQSRFGAGVCPPGGFCDPKPSRGRGLRAAPGHRPGQMFVASCLSGDKQGRPGVAGRENPPLGFGNSPAVPLGSQPGPVPSSLLSPLG